MSEQQRTDWWSRNRKWYVAVGCGGFILFVVSFVALILIVVIGVFKSSDVYKESLSAARGNPDVRQAIGEPIEAGRFVSGSMNISGASGDAELAIPISGPKGSGTIYAVATKSAGRWTFTLLEVKIEGSHARIDLLGTQEVQERTTTRSSGPQTTRGR